MTAKHAKEMKLPTAKAVLDEIGPLADWYRRNRPDVKSIAVDPLQMMRIEQMIGSAKRQGFEKRANGRVYYMGYRVYVGSATTDGDGSDAPAV